ncbi:hypothetical protein LINPERPRIM_LOCUS22875 [Linum perenne]
MLRRNLPLPNPESTSLSRSLPASTVPPRITTCVPAVRTLATSSRIDLRRRSMLHPVEVLHWITSLVMVVVTSTRESEIGFCITSTFLLLLICRVSKCIIKCMSFPCSGLSFGGSICSSCD